MGHTAEPWIAPENTWSYDNRYDNQGNLAPDSTMADYCVRVGAEMPYVEVDGEEHYHQVLANVYGRSEEEAKANAKLVAASPELLKTIKGCRDMLLEAAKQFRLNGDEGHANMVVAHAVDADAIIEKATP